MERKRAQAIIIQNNNALFGYGLIDQEYRHFFIGGGIEEGETPEEAIIREVREEANVEGNIIFYVGEENNHFTFLVDIGEQKPILGCDPEESQAKLDISQRCLQELKFIPLNNVNQFTLKDIKYFKFLIKECKDRSYFPEWYELMVRLVESFK